MNNFNRITDLETLSYIEDKNTNTRHGVYRAKWRGKDTFFVVSNNIGYVLAHYNKGSELNHLTQWSEEELFNLLGFNLLK